MTSTALEKELVEPIVFVSVVARRRYEPRSFATGVYVVVMAPVIALHPAGGETEPGVDTEPAGKAVEHRYHWFAVDERLGFAVVVAATPTSGVPTTAGSGVVAAVACVGA